jgi:ferritin-like metal-binding protein YciE
MSQNTAELNSKLVEYFDEALAIENAAIDRIQSRIEECPIPQGKQRLQQHLESKADLSTPKPPTTQLMKKTLKDTVKSVTGKADNPLPEEMELIRSKEDAILEHAEIIGYKMLIQLSQRANAQDAIPILKQNLQEEESMATWIMDNTPTMLDQLWPKIQSAVTSSSK